MSAAGSPDPSSPFLRIVVGATASGKESLALALAERLDGEIVSVDSMKVYRGLDIATAKASAEDQRRVRHHCLDLVGPDKEFSAADFVAAADAAILGIARRGKAVILSGGTAFYYRALLDGLFEGPGADRGVRRELEERAARDGAAALHADLERIDPAAAAKIHPSDLRRLVRALEVVRLTGGPISSRQREWDGFHRRGGDDAGTARLFVRPRYRFAMARLVRSRDDVRARIRSRVARMVGAGLEEEARRVYESRAGLSRTPLQAVGYKELFPYFAGEADWEDVLERLILNTNKLVRGQDTWFRKFPAVPIQTDGDSADELAGRLLGGGFAG